jgi:hypothetical protein
LISLDRREYFYYRDLDVLKWEHPTTAVALIGLATLAQGIGAAIVFATSFWGRMWRRGTAALVLLIPWALWTSMFVVHSPGFWMLHLLWEWLLVIALSVATVISFGADLYSRVVGRRRLPLQPSNNKMQQTSHG